MKKVRCIYQNECENDYFLTLCKIYDVIEYIPHGLNESYDKIVIIDDISIERMLYVYDYKNNKRFQDVTSEYRNDIIVDILN